MCVYFLADEHRASASFSPAIYWICKKDPTTHVFNRSGVAACTGWYCILLCQQGSTVPGINCVCPLETRMSRQCVLSSLQQPEEEEKEGAIVTDCQMQIFASTPYFHKVWKYPKYKDAVSKEKSYWDATFLHKCCSSDCLVCLFLLLVRLFRGLFVCLWPTWGGKTCVQTRCTVPVAFEEFSEPVGM